MPVNGKAIFTALVWMGSLILIGSLIGNFSMNDVNTWYHQLNRSPLTPPDYVFGIAWTLLYALIGLAGWLIWSHNNANQSLLKIAYLTQLFLNWLWTPLFFVYHLTGTSLLNIFLIIILVLYIVSHSYKKNLPVALLLTPYLLWLIFAGYLNLYICLYN